MRTFRFPIFGMLFALFVCIIWDAAGSPASADKSYRVGEVAIDAGLDAAGGLEVTESRTYHFNGAYHYAYRTLPLIEGIEYNEFSVSENGGEYLYSDSEEPGTFFVRRKTAELEIRWYFQAKNESRVFDFHYRVNNLIRRYEDAAIFYFKFVGSEWRVAQNNVNVRLRPPVPIQKDQLNEWLHGPLWAESIIQDDGTVVAWCEQLPKRTFLEVRALYPPQLFPGAPARQGAIRPQVMEQEAGWVEEANLRRAEAIQRAEQQKALRALGPKIMIPLSLLGLFLWYLLYRKYGRRDETFPVSGAFTGIPSSTPPAQVGYLLNDRTVAPRDLVATLVDLARRGFIKIREEQIERKMLFGGTKKGIEYYWDLQMAHHQNHADQLLEYEHKLIRFLFGVLADGEETISMTQVKKGKGKFQKFFPEWTKSVKATAKQKEYFDLRSYTGRNLSFGLAAVLCALGIAGIIFFQLWGLMAIGAGILVIILSVGIAHRTEKGEREALQWKAFKKYLKSFNVEAAGSSGLLDKLDICLVYGLILGLDKRIYGNIVAAIPTESAKHILPWYLYHDSHGGVFSHEAFASGFSSMIATTTSSVSTSSGAGGGASGGGG
ncbi:MAG: DUF2207 domain-containing protein, partial [Candidatus Eisenbacteria bacterium]|nr:DUF2207 domain-containing protein [Candidatus Eisenbacteria bacterium]